MMAYEGQESENNNSLWPSDYCDVLLWQLQNSGISLLVFFINVKISSHIYFFNLKIIIKLCQLMLFFKISFLVAILKKKNNAKNINKMIHVVR